MASGGHIFAAQIKVVILQTFFFYVLLTVYLSTILVTGQLNAKIHFYNKFIIFLYMFRALCANHQEVKIVLYGICYHQTL